MSVILPQPLRIRRNSRFDDVTMRFAPLRLLPRRAAIAIGVHGLRRSVL